MENITEFIYNLFMTNGIVIAMAAFVVGQIIKQIEVVPDKFIPLICGLLGLALGVLVPSCFPEEDMVIRSLNGLALGWAATGGFETIKQLSETNAKG